VGEAILLIELVMEMVKEEKEEGEEDDENERRTAQYHQEIRCLLCCWNSRARST
jgi:cytochrome c-type biogenesis protein CcmH/NrfF